MKELHDLMEDENQRVYIQYSFLVKKVYMKFEKKGPLRKIPRDQLQNFAFFFRRIFEKEEERVKVNDFLMYSLLRFASFIESPEKESLIERFRGFPLVDRPKFWRAILAYMSKHIYRHLNDKKGVASEKKDVSGGSFIKSVQGFFKMNNSKNKDTAPKPSQVKSFEEISNILFRIKLEFDGIVDILLILGRENRIPGQLIRQILNRNKEVLHQQMTDLTKVKLTKRDLESLQCIQSYDALIRKAKGLNPRKSINLKSVNDPHIDSLTKEFEKKSEAKTSKIIQVLNLSLHFLVAKYDERGALVRRSPIKSSTVLDSSNLSRDVSVPTDHLGPTMKTPKNKGSTVKDMLNSVRSYDVQGIDDFLESATKISQASRPQSPEKKKKKKRKKKVFSFELDERVSRRKQEWVEKYSGQNDSISTDLRDIFRCLMMCRAVHQQKSNLVQKILLTVWPLSIDQRKFLYIELTSDSLSRDALLDYEEHSYAFTRIKSKEVTPVKSRPNRQFGESFMKIDRKKGELTETIGNDFEPSESQENPMTEEESFATINETSLIAKTEDSGNPFLSGVTQDSEAQSFKSETPRLYQNTGKTFHSEMPIGVRKEVERHRSRSRTRVHTLPTKLKRTKQKVKPGDNIITLDVKRTHVERKEFDHVSLEQVLRNIAHPKMGNFAYYQGLNYIVAYVLDVLRDPVETYNVSITLMELHFRKYVNHNMDNLNILFYILRRLLQVFLPNLAEHIDRNENMEANATYANWFLTLFTTLKQFKQNVRLLDQVFDVFLAAGWVGFFKCVLVMFYYLEEDILALQSEEMIMFLNDFTKKGFERLGEKLVAKSRQKGKPSLARLPSDPNLPGVEPKRLPSLGSQAGLEAPGLFNFKREIREFGLVNKLLLVEFAMEYHNMREAVEKKWIEVLKKVDANAKKK